ncbi:MAG TPA: PadR family transcriptional regulator [Bryobacteraceae bacterium]|nr:PadR family transcriptional regulator [Bryobacteraceae bacterium]
MQPVAGMYELFILGKLMHRPMHGYLLQSIVNAALGPYRCLSWGTLYPLLRRLEQGGFIVALGGDPKDGRGTKSYRITARGRQRFLALMRSGAEPDTDFRDVFRIRLANFGHLRTAEQAAILEEYRNLLAALVSHSEAMAAAVQSAPGMAQAERPYVLSAIDHQRYLAASEMAWLNDLIQATGGDDEKTTKNARVDSKPRGTGSGRNRARSGRARGK